MIAKIGEWVKQHQHDLWLYCCMALVAWSAYNLGRIYAPNSPLHPQPAAKQGSASAAFATRPSNTPKPTPDRSDPRVFASKSGTKYYFSWCSSRIKEGNKIWFASGAAAIAKGYTIASSCK